VETLPHDRITFDIYTFYKALDPGTEYLFRRKRQENYCRDMPQEVIFTEENKLLS
jgi:hypothetical protein